jgi:hypothetical protein
MRRNLISAEAFTIFVLYISCGTHQYHKNRGIKQLPPAEPHGAERLRYNGVLPVAPKGSFATLPSPPQCYAAFGTMRHTLAPVHQSPVCRPRTHKVTYITNTFWLVASMVRWLVANHLRKRDVGPCGITFMIVCYNHCNNNAVKGFRALWDNTVFTTHVSATLILLPLMAGNKLYSTGNFLISCVIMSFSGRALCMELPRIVM